MCDHVVYPDGKVCISILHPPGDDQYGYEKASERWSPVQTVESILLSVISMVKSLPFFIDVRMTSNGRERERNGRTRGDVCRDFEFT